MADAKPVVRLQDLVGQKPRAGLDPSDPVFLVASVLLEAQKEMLTQLTKVVDDVAGKLTEASKAAEAAARMTADSLVTQAGQWTGQKIREAGDLVLARIQAELQATNNTARRATKAAWIAAGSAAAGLAMVTGGMLALVTWSW